MRVSAKLIAQGRSDLTQVCNLGSLFDQRDSISEMAGRSISRFDADRYAGCGATLRANPLSQNLIHHDPLNPYRPP